MATYQEIMDAARNAHNAGDTEAARRLVQMAQRVGNQPALETPDGRATATGTTQAQAGDIPPEMVFDPRTGGYVDTSLPAFQEMTSSSGAGAFARGAGQGVSLGGIDETVAAAYGATGPGTYAQNRDFALALQRAKDANARENNPAAYIGGEIVGGATLPLGARSVKSAAAIGGATAGALEFGQGEGGVLQRLQGVPTAAAAGAATAGLLDGALRAGSRAINGPAPKRPELDDLRAAKNAAYQAVEDANEVFAPDEIDNLVLGIQQKLDDSNYVSGYGDKMDSMLARMYRMADRQEPVTLSQVDRVRQRLWEAYRSAPDEVEILDAISSIDDMIGGRAATSELMAAARQANSVYAKRQMLEAALTKASDQTASTGSGGNTLNKFRQAITSIINTPKKARWFSADEVARMREFVRGGTSENTARRIGKLSPDGNGLMLALNIGAAAADPRMIAVGATGAASKAIADRSAERGANSILDMISGFTPRAPLNNMLAPAAGVAGSQDALNQSLLDYLQGS